MVHKLQLTVNAIPEDTICCSPLIITAGTMPIIKFIESAGVFIVRAYNAWKFDKCYSRVTIAKQSL